MAYDSKGSSGKMMKSKSNTHRMPDGKVMTGKTHSKNSTEVKSKKKKTNVSWMFGGKKYFGTLIPSRETKTHRYARTENGKIKSLPKK